MGLQESLAIMTRLVTAKDNAGRPLLLIDEECCPKLIRALKGEYRYPVQGEPGYGAAVQEPLKGPACNNADHIVDSFRYAVVNMFRLLKIENIGISKRRKSSNPTRYPR
jgi:hypothetical protein